MLDFDHDDIQAVIKAAKDVRPKHHGWIANPLSSLPEPKAKLKAAIINQPRKYINWHTRLILS